MITKFIAVAVGICISAGATAQPPRTQPKIQRVAATPAPSAAARGAVIDNIIGRVQMDALIDTIVSSDSATATAERRSTTTYATIDWPPRRDRG